MKQLKKISLQKEDLMSLNAPQMDAIKGGTSPVVTVTTSSMPCTQAITIVGEYIYDVITGNYHGDDWYNPDDWLHNDPYYYTELPVIDVKPKP